MANQESNEQSSEVGVRRHSDTIGTRNEIHTPAQFVNALESLRHDANNLLFALRPNINLLRNHDNSAVDPEGSNAVRAIADGVGFLQALINHSADHQQANTKQFTDLHQWWNVNEHLLRSVLPAHVKLLRVKTGKLPRIAIAPIKLTQAILNLLINAGDAMTKRSIQNGVIMIEAVKHQRPSHDSMIHILLRDNAGGFTPSALHAAFEEKTSHTSDGRGGLGLRIVHGIVRDVGGDIRISSESGLGTSIHIELPIANTQCPPPVAHSWGIHDIH